jgi:hypothetical protein
MAFLPIDLQTMFSNLNQVSKEQSVQKDEVPVQQNLQGQEIAKKTEENDSSVSETHHLGDGVDKISEEEKKKQAKEKKKQGKKSKSNADEDENKEVVKDPLLGHHIDVTR